MRVEFTKSAKKQFFRLNEPDLSRIAKAINGLECEPPEGDIKELKGQKGVFRLKIGGYRILYTKGTLSIDVFKIAPRGQAYKRSNKK